MTRRRWMLVSIAAGLVLLAGVLFFTVERLVPPRRSAVSPPRRPGPAAAPHITATLFYGSVDGQALIALRRDVPLADTLVAQGIQILRAQLGAAPAPLVSVIPRGTTLRGFYVAGSDAFVDLSREVSAAHPGGSLMELLTVYAVVNAVTANLPKVQRVQILVDGKEVDTLAGHVDLQRPLSRDRSLVREK